MIRRGPGRLVYLCLALAGAASAQSVAPDTSPSPPPVRVSTGSVPSVVTVGDRFQTVVRLAAPSGSRIDFPQVLSGSAAVQSVAPVRVLPGADGEHTASYTMVAWQTGTPVLPPLPVRVTTADGAQHVFPVRLRLPEVQSVLPAGDSVPDPRGPKPIWQRPPSWRPLLLVLAALALAVGYVAWRWRQRLPVGLPVPLPPPNPREQALAALSRAATLLPTDREALVAEVAAALRQFLSAVSNAWGADLTTAELLGELESADVAGREVARLGELLRTADLVKFARHDPSPGEAEGVLSAARSWIAGFALPGSAPEADAVREAA